MNQSEIYAAFLATRNTELTTLWTRFHIYLLVNSGFLLAFVTSECDELLQSLKFLPQVFGLLLCLVWLFSEFAGRKNLRYFDDRVAEFEKEIVTTQSLRNCRLLADKPEFFKCQSYVSKAFIFLFLFAWIILFFTPV